MTRNIKASLLCLSVLFVGACKENEQKGQSFEQTRMSFKSINSALVNDSDKSVQMLPFDEPYLKARYEVLTQADKDAYTELQRAELDYLTIEQRYPQRFLPWPAMVDVANNLTDKQVTQWYKLVHERLLEAEQSKIKLNRYELAALREYTEKSTDLSHYLSNYRARSRLGLYQLPNGKEWYQSKLNFYLGDAKEPQQLLSELQNITSNISSNFDYTYDLSNSVAYTLLSSRCEPYSGLNWKDGYINLPATVKNCNAESLKQYKHAAVTLAKIDLGIHFQAWSQKQATLEIQNQLGVSEEQAQSLLNNIVFYPATIFALVGIWI